jgi:thioredoxin reductase
LGNTAQILVTDLHDLLRDRPPFDRLGDTYLERLLSDASVVDLKPNDFFKEKYDPSSAERIYFVVDGQMGVIKERPLGIDGTIPKSHLPNPGREYLLHLSRHDFFSNEFLRTISSAPERSIQCIAVMRTTLLCVPAKTVKDVMRMVPEWADALTDRGSDLKKHYDKHRAGDLRVIQSFYLQHNFSYATTMKVIDLDRCIGCDGCERACADRHGVARLQRKGPALGRLSFAVACRTCTDHRCFDACGFDAISLLENDEVKIDNQKCVGCAACFSACPNNVITMQDKPFTGADFKERIPATDLDGRTNIPGLWLCGEATGTALIKLAINSGRKAVECISKEIGSDLGGDGDILDVIVAGAGPAGLSAALAAKELALDFKVFDKGHFAQTIQSYPRHKVVMAEPMHIPLFGNLWLKDTTKEELIQQWQAIIEKTGLEIQGNEPVKDLKRGADGIFDVTTEKGKYRARHVVLAVGTRGSPRKLGVEGEVAGRVYYQLTEPDEMRNKRVLIVGGGDSAVEGAMSLADVPGTTVTISYRKDSFGRIKPRNKTRLDAYERDGKVKVILESEVKMILAGEVLLTTKNGMRSVPNDVVFAMLGAEPPTKFFEKIGIKVIDPGTEEMEALAKSRGMRRYASKCDHCTGHSDQACISACPTNAIIEIMPEEVFMRPTQDEARRPAFQVAPFESGIPSPSSVRWVAAIALMVALISAVAVGLECFARRTIPEWSLLYRWQTMHGLPIDVALISGSGLGYVLGIAGSILMAMTALYPLHSRLGLLRKVAKTRFWLSGHILAGILGPVFVTYHTMLKLNRWPSVAFWLVWAVVFTGAIGRHLVTFVRRARGLVDMDGVVIDRERQRLIDELEERRGHTRVLNLLDLVPYENNAGAISLFRASVMVMFGEAVFLAEYQWMKHVALRNVKDPRVRDRALEVIKERRRHEFKSAILDRISKSASLWRWAHAIATIVMFAVAIAHIVAAMLFKVS